MAQLRPEAQDDRDHRARVPGTPMLSGRGRTRQWMPPFTRPESRRVPAPIRRHTVRRRPYRACAIAVALLATAIVPAGLGPAGAQQISLNVASKNFAGAQVLSQVYGQALASQGAHVTFVDDVGPTELVFPALQTGTYDAYADYQGTLLSYLGGRPTANGAKTHAALVAKLQGTGITVSQAAPAVDVNGFFVTRKTAKRYRLSTVSDLAKVAPKLSIGAPPECPVRPLCLGEASQRAYGLKFAKVLPIDPNGPATQRALPAGHS